MKAKMTSAAGVCWRKKTKKIGGRTVEFMEPYACKQTRSRPAAKNTATGGRKRKRSTKKSARRTTR